MSTHALDHSPARPPFACCLALAALALSLPCLAMAGTHDCTGQALHGRYVFTGSGFTRSPASPPGSPWVPKAILEVLHFDGHGGVTTPSLTAANPFGDTGGIVQAAGAPGTYQVNRDCSGSVSFTDPNHVAFAIHVNANGGAIRMIQTNPSNNVFQGVALRQR